MMRKTHERRGVPFSYALREELPHLTPIVGDIVAYETWAGDPLHRHDALTRLKAGGVVYYTTWEDSDE